MGLIRTPKITLVGTARPAQVTTSIHRAFLSASQSNWAMIIMWETGTLAFMSLSPDSQLILPSPANTESFPLCYLPPPRFPRLHHTHSHSCSSFFTSLIHFSRRSSFPRKRSPELSIHLMIQFFRNAIRRSALAASEAASRWWNSHSTGGQTNRTPHAFGNNFCRLIMRQCGLTMVQSCVQCLHLLVRLYVFAAIYSPSFTQCSKIQTQNHNQKKFVQNHIFTKLNFITCRWVWFSIIIIHMVLIPFEMNFWVGKIQQLSSLGLNLH